MVKYRITVATTGGEILEQTREAPSGAILREMLNQENLLLMSIRRSWGLPFLKSPFSRLSIRPQELTVFSRELAILIKAGTPIPQALEVLREQASSASMRGIMASLSEGLKQGKKLFEVMAEYPKAFPEYFWGSIRAVEGSDRLIETLFKLHEHLASIQKARKKIVTASIYPLFLLTVSLAALFFLTFQVVPAFSKFYGEFDSQLPRMTQFIVSGAGFLKDWLWLALLIGVTTPLGLGVWRRTPKGRKITDDWILKVPGLGGLIERHTYARLFRTVSTLLHSGMFLADALEKGAATVSNVQIHGRLLEARKFITEGTSIGDAFRRSNLLPKATAAMIQVGQEAGSLEDTLSYVAELYEEQAEVRINALTAALEPAFVLLAGGFVAFLLLAMYMPIYQMSTVIH